MSSYFEFRIADNETAYPPEVHYHNDYEIYYLTDGKCHYFIGNRTYWMTAGDIVLIPPGVIHKVVYESPTHSRMLFNCTEDYIPPSVKRVTDKLAHFSHTPETAKRVASIYRQIRDAFALQDEYWEDTVRCCAAQLLLLMAKNTTIERTITTGSPFVEKAVSYIHTNYMNKLSLQETAGYCAVSPEHLSRVFKRETGFGFNEYVKLYRLKKAESLLKSGRLRSVSAVALQCGYSDSNYFSNAYKKMYGTSPSQVKKQSEQEDDYV